MKLIYDINHILGEYSQYKILCWKFYFTTIARSIFIVVFFLWLTPKQFVYLAEFLLYSIWISFSHLMYIFIFGFLRKIANYQHFQIHLPHSSKIFIKPENLTYLLEISWFIVIHSQIKQQDFSFYFYLIILINSHFHEWGEYSVTF